MTKFDAMIARWKAANEAATKAHLPELSFAEFADKEIMEASNITAEQLEERRLVLDERELQHKSDRRGFRGY